MSSSPDESSNTGGSGINSSLRLPPGCTSSEKVCAWMVLWNSSLKYVNRYGASSSSRRHAWYWGRSRPSMSMGSLIFFDRKSPWRSSFSSRIHSSKTDRSGHCRVLLRRRSSCRTSRCPSSSASECASVGKQTSSSTGKATVRRRWSVSWDKR